MSKTLQNMSPKKGISLIIPALNEEKTIAEIIQKCTRISIVKQLIIINDGSTDNTKNILNLLFKRNRKKGFLKIINHSKNQGKGAAIKTGLKQAVYDYIMIQDADAEYSPADIEKLYKKTSSSKNGIVFGSRSKNKKSYLLAQLGNFYLNIMFNLLFGLRLSDCYTCYKLIPRSIWIESDLKSNGFELDAELISKLGMKGYDIIEVPISYNPRKYSEGKKINWQDLIKASVVALRVRIYGTI